MQPRDPYTLSGESAAAEQARRMAIETLQSSIADADTFRQHGHAVIRRGRRHTWYGAVAMAAAAALIAWIGSFMAAGYDNTIEGAMRMNWSMLGVFIAIGLFCYAWSWLSVQRRLLETGARIIRRADYQRRLAEARMQEVQHESIR